MPADFEYPEVIYLAPWCTDCDKTGWGENLTWCQDAHEPCDECGRLPVKFVRCPGGLLGLQAALAATVVKEG